MSHGSTYCPASHLKQMGVRVDYVDDLPDCGRFILEERRVEIRTGLDPVIERSCLAHEAAHAELRHEAQEAWCHHLQQERMASAMAGRRLIDYERFIELQKANVPEKQQSAELGVARVVIRAYQWLTSPAWKMANGLAVVFAPLLGMELIDLTP